MNGAPERDNDQKGIGRSWEESKGAFAAPFTLSKSFSYFYFWLSWKRLLTSAQFTTFHHSFR
jgi:hypothetical protein